MRDLLHACRRRAGWASLCVVLAAAPVRASVFYVDLSAMGTNNGTSWNNAFVSLQSALDVAIAGDEIRVADGTYYPTKLVHPNAPWSATFRILSGVSLRAGFAGSGAPDPDERDPVAHPSILSGAKSQWTVVSVIDNFGTADFDGFTVRDGTLGAGAYYGAGMLLNDSSLVVRDCTFEDNVAAFNDGGAVAILLGGEQTFVHCTFTANAGSRGAAIWMAGTGSQSALQCNFGDNIGPAITAQSTGIRTLSQCSFHGNSTSFDGFTDDGTSTLVSCSFQDEVSSMLYGWGHIVMKDCSIAGCGTMDYSGAPAIALVEGGDLTLDGCTFTDNVGKVTGGTISIMDSTLSARNCLVEGGLCAVQLTSLTAGGGGGLFAKDSTSTLINCRFVGNKVVPAGLQGGHGGAAVIEGGTAKFVNCLFTGNRAVAAGTLGSAGLGGAVLALSAVPEFFGCSLSGNAAVGTGNTPGLTGGIRGECTVSNSILWANTDSSGSGEAAQLSGTQVAVNNSCVQGLTGALGGAGNIGADPLFVDADGADDVVGTIDDDLRLGAGSPCTDAGSIFLVPDDPLDLDLDGNVAELLPLDLDRTGRIADDLTVADTGPGPAPDIDMGAYERSAWKNLGAALGGTNGKPFLFGLGTLQGGTLVSLPLTNALPLATSFVCIGAGTLNAPFKGGTLVPDINAPGFVLPLPITAAGSLGLAGFWPLGMPPGISLYFQEWFADPQAPQGFAASNATQATTP
jgi:hypothetical protein